MHAERIYKLDVLLNKSGGRTIPAGATLVRNQLLVVHRSRVERHVQAPGA